MGVGEGKGLQTLRLQQPRHVRSKRWTLRRRWIRLVSLCIASSEGILSKPTHASYVAPLSYHCVRTHAHPLSSFHSVDIQMLLFRQRLLRRVL